MTEVTRREAISSSMMALNDIERKRGEERKEIVRENRQVASVLSDEHDLPKVL